MKRKTRLIITVAAIWIALTAIFLHNGWSTFFTQLTDKPVNYLDMTVDDVKLGRGVSGECYIVYDLIAEGYTEETSKYTSSKKVTTDNYYWVLPCDDNTLMILKTGANDATALLIDSMVDAFWEADTIDEYLEQYPNGVQLDGVFVKNDSEIVAYYDEWAADLKEVEGFENTELAPYMLDCSTTFAARMSEFTIGAVMLLITIFGIVIAIVVAKKGSKGGSVPQAAVGASYGGVNNGGYETYGAQNNVGNTAYGAANTGFQSQGNTVYGSTGTDFQSQGNTAYGSTGTDFQSQGNTAYGSTGTGFQSQGSTSYGSAGTGIPSQNGSGFGSAGTGFPSQSGSMYGSTFGSTDNNGSNQ